MLPDAFYAAYAGLVGACLGSFLNVCIYRLPEGLSVVSPPSRCGSCGARVGWRDNIPILGWLLLRGKCRSCGVRLSVQYPLVEAAVAAIWALAVLLLGATWAAFSAAIFFTLLLGIALTDARTYIIPDEFSIGGTIAGLALSFAPGGITPRAAFIGAAVGFVLLWVVAEVGERVFRKPAMGGGDIKMMAMLGAFLGTSGVLLTLFLGALLGVLIFGPITLKTGKLVPFGIFLALGAAVVQPFGAALIDWYLRLVLG